MKECKLGFTYLLYVCIVNGRFLRCGPTILVWIVLGKRPTFLFQVRIREHSRCRPLHEDELKPIIASNYYEKRFFWFELDREQDERLMKLFLSS